MKTRSTEKSPRSKKLPKPLERMTTDELAEHLWGKRGARIIKKFVHDLDEKNTSKPRSGKVRKER